MNRHSVHNQIDAKNRIQKSDFTLTFQPIYYISRIIGLIPFSISFDLNGEPQRPKVGKFDSIWLIISISVYLYGAWSFIKKFESPSDPQESSYIIIYIDNAILVIGLLLGVLAVVLDWWNRYKLVEILEKLLIFDKEVKMIFII